jgi:hypothetical protein
LEDPYFGCEVDLQFPTKTAQKLCRLRPQRAASLLSSLSGQTQLKWFGELEIAGFQIQNPELLTYPDEKLSSF